MLNIMRKMEFSSYGFYVYSPEVDDHAVDFIAKSNTSGILYQVQVKAFRALKYTYVTKPEKSKKNLYTNYVIALVKLIEGTFPEIYLFPVTDWNTPNALLRDRNYAGKKSEPEWGFNLNKKNEYLLKNYTLEKRIIAL